MITHKEQKEKALRASFRELQCLWEADKELQLVKLEEPYQRGWKRFYVLTERSAQRLDSSVLIKILPYLNSTVFCHRPEFIRREGRSKKMIEIKQFLRSICPCKWQSENLPDDWKKYFRLERTGWNHTFEYVFAHPWFYELIIIPNWITHVRKIDPKVKSRIAEIQNRFANYQLWPLHSRLEGKPAKWRWDRENAKQQMLSREAEKEIRAYIKGEVTVEVFAILLPKLQSYLFFNYLEHQPDKRAGLVC